MSTVHFNFVDAPRLAHKIRFLLISVQNNDFLGEFKIMISLINCFYVWLVLDLCNFFCYFFIFMVILLIIYLIMFVVSGEDGRSRAEQLLHILRQLDPYVSSSAEHQRRRGCVAVHEVLIKFRNLCSGGFGVLGSYPTFTRNKQIDQGGTRSMSGLPCMLNVFLRLLV